MSIKQDNRQLYLQVIDKIRQDIASGVYREHEKLPSEFVWAKKLGVSRATLREALRVLEEDKVIIRRHGVGTFVNNATPLFTSGIEQLNSVTDMIREANMTPGTLFLSSSIMSATEEDMERFDCRKDEKFLLIERVRTANGDPVVYCQDKIPVSAVADEAVFQEESLLALLEDKAGIQITYAVADIKPIGYDEKISPILNCGPETALLLLKQTHFDSHDKPYLHSANFFRSDKFHFHILRKRI